MAAPGCDRYHDKLCGTKNLERTASQAGEDRDQPGTEVQPSAAGWRDPTGLTDKA